MEVEKWSFEFVMKPNKQVLFDKIAHPYHSPKITFENSAEVIMTHINISAAVTAKEIVMCIF